MPYAIELYLDKKSAEKVRSMRTKLRESGVNIDEGTKPHVSLAIYQELNIRVFRPRLQDFSKQKGSLNVSLASIGMFTTEYPVVFLAPTVTDDLLSFHKEFHDYFREFDGAAWDYYRPGKWVPHCTLAMNLSDEMVGKAIEITRRFSLPIRGALDRIGVLEFSPNKQLFEYEMISEL
jgi:2'-5' RNA ligase